MQTTNLTKREIVLSIYDKTNLPQKDIQTIVQLCLDNIQAALAAGRDVELRNFGVFEVQVRKQRVGRNPNRPETDVTIPERAVVKFKAGKELKAEMKQISLAAVKGKKRTSSTEDADE
jgi:nucleoid DNA-binding protein